MSRITASVPSVSASKVARLRPHWSLRSGPEPEQLLERAGEDGDPAAHRNPERRQPAREPHATAPVGDAIGPVDGAVRVAQLPRRRRSEGWEMSVVGSARSRTPTNFESVPPLTAAPATTMKAVATIPD